MNFLQDFANGVKAIAEHFPQADMEVYTDTIIIKCHGMNTLYWRKNIPVKQFIESCGFYWDHDHNIWEYYQG